MDIKHQIEKIEKRVESIEEKLNDPTWIKSISAKISGNKTSALKAEKSRENGKKGGRPRKERDEYGFIKEEV